ncbi:molybdopterin-synthase adenylyltransferase MoeB [Sphingomonas sp.]|uniref:HesA/MoeB/ThiF family protein n=1 Tax=Sphingomonas sp. TaxID=28214 RepID=UPI002582EFF9|nr:molybdopterin-synthase adenylyltransferase MoeB [Sphingomonas sp.]
MSVHAMLTDEELTRYARHIVLKEVGGAGQLKLRAAHVLVIGAGGIGSPAIQYLAAAGVGRLTIVDDDRVDLSNLQRQTIYATDDIGRGKADAAAAAARRLNPHVAASGVTMRIDAANVDALIAGADVVLDGCDNFATRLRVADACLAARTPLVSAAIGQFDGQLATFRGWEADKPCYRCFVGDDPERAGVSCAEDGVLGPMAGMIGSLAALETIRGIAPFGEDSAGLLLLADTLALRFRTLRLPKDPGCRGCGRPDH